MKPPGELIRLIRESEITTCPEVDERILCDARKKLAKRRRHRSSLPDTVLWRILMKRKAASFAAVTLIIIVTLIGFQLFENPVGSNLTFAQAIEPILNADAIAYDVAIGGGPVIHIVARGSCLRRTYNEGKTISIWNLDENRILNLDAEKMEAQYLNVQGYPRELGNPVESLKSILSLVKDIPNVTVEDLGLNRIDGHDAVGFFASYPGGEITIWADANSKHPVRVEANRGEFLIWNYKFDIPMEEELFSMEVPAGYKLIEKELTGDLRGGTETQFIEGLRLLAERVNNGEFTLCESPNDLYKWTIDFRTRLGAINLPEEEMVAIKQGMLDMVSFLHYSLKGEWTYRGEGAMLGDSDTPIFWYRPVGSGPYRVIYGDLHVENVAPDSLPR